MGLHWLCIQGLSLLPPPSLSHTCSLPPGCTKWVSTPRPPWYVPVCMSLCCSPPPGESARCGPLFLPTESTVHRSEQEGPVATCLTPCQGQMTFLCILPLYRVPSKVIPPIYWLSPACRAQCKHFTRIKSSDTKTLTLSTVKKLKQEKAQRIATGIHTG